MGTDWSQPQKPNIIVDRNDKESWPSIGGDHSESTSENGDDNASVKSGSVISVSSNQGQSLDKSSGSSAIQSQSASSLWSAANSYNGMESNTWGAGLGSMPTSSAASINSLGWNSTLTSLSVNNQGHNMQSITSMAGSNDLSNQMNLNNPTVATSRMSGNWGANVPGSLPQGQGNNQGGIRPQASVQIPQSLSSSIGNVQTVMQGQMSSGAVQQPNGPHVSSAVSAVSQGQSTSSTSSQQNVHTSSGFQGMSASSVFSSKSQAELAWGSVGAGTTTQMGTNASGGGGDAANAGKGNGNNGQMLKSNESATSGWGAPPMTDNDAKNSSDSWSGNPSSGGDWSSSAPTNAQWGSTLPTGKQGPPPQQWPGSTIPTTGQNPNNPPRSQPPTWAQAAGKGLDTSPSNTTTSDPSASPGNITVPPTTPVDPVHEELQRAIESHDGWGQRPVRQDTAWDTSQAQKTQRKPSTNTDKPSTSSNSNMWNNNSGTAIWESSKDNSAWNSAQGGAPSQQDMYNRGDPKSWNGPPKQTSNPNDVQGNSWGGPPPKDKNWGNKEL